MPLAPRPPAAAPVRPGALAGLTVTVFGRGRVGQALGGALRLAGAGVSTQAGRRSPGGDPGGAAGAGLPVSDLVILCVPDDALAAVATAVLPQVRPGQVVAHTSGRHGVAVLAPVLEVGAHRLAMHPAMTFAGDPGDVERIRGCSVGLTADPDALPTAERLCAALGCPPVWIAESARDLYHAALAHGANHLVTIVAQAQLALAAAGVADPSELLRPLLSAALTGALARGAAATTGPVVRGDAHTVAAHLAALPGSIPGLAESYRALASATVELAAGDGRLDDGDADAVRMALVTR